MSLLWASAGCKTEADSRQQYHKTKPQLALTYELTYDPKQYQYDTSLFPQALTHDLTAEKLHDSLQVLPAALQMIAQRWGVRVTPVGCENSVPTLLRSTGTTADADARPQAQGIALLMH